VVALEFTQRPCDRLPRGADESKTCRQ
jgi:hypothetical protein